MLRFLHWKHIFFQRIGSHWGIQTRMNWEKHTFCHHREKHAFCHHSGAYNKGHCCAICVICCVIRIGINNVWCALKCFLSEWNSYASIDSHGVHLGDIHWKQNKSFMFCIRHYSWKRMYQQNQSSMIYADSLASIAFKV